MKTRTKCVATVVGLTFVGVVGRATLVQGEGTTAPMPGPIVAPRGPILTVPTIPLPGSGPGTTAASGAECCLVRVHKKAEGRRMGKFGARYKCQRGTDSIATDMGDVRLELKLTTEGPPCDEPNEIPNGSTLEARGRMIRRSDTFSYFVGQFTIKNPAGAQLFTGTLHTLDRVGTHHAPFGGEACDNQSHFEGWIEGGNTENKHRLRALIVARGPVPNDPSGVPVTASIDGAIIACK